MGKTMSSINQLHATYVKRGITNKEILEFRDIIVKANLSQLHFLKREIESKIQRRIEIQTKLKIWNKQKNTS